MAPDNYANNGDVGISIPQLSTSISILTGEVDVSVTVKNEYRLPLKTVRIFLIAYDHDGKVIPGTTGVLEVPGPILRNQALGPFKIASVMQDRDVRCVQVSRVEAIRLDYVTLYATGADANNLVRGESRRACAAAG